MTCKTFQFRPSFRSCLNLAANRSRAVRHVSSSRVFILPVSWSVQSIQARGCIARTYRCDRGDPLSCALSYTGYLQLVSWLSHLSERGTEADAIWSRLKLGPGSDQAGVRPVAGKGLEYRMGRSSAARQQVAAPLHSSEWRGTLRIPAVPCGRVQPRPIGACLSTPSPLATPVNSLARVFGWANTYPAGLDQPVTDWTAACALTVC